MNDEASELAGRVLVVEDEEELGTTLGIFLREEGNEVTVVANYDGAVAAIEARDFDVVLTDIVMPGKNGVDVLARVGEKDPGCPVVMITGYPDAGTAAAAVRLGAFDYLLKPVRYPDLVRAVRQALAKRAVVLENRRLEQYNREQRERLEERVEEQTRELGAIAEIGRIIGSAPDIDQIYELLAKGLKRLVPFDALVIDIVDLERGMAVTDFTLDPKGGPRRGREPWPLEGTLTQEVVERQRSLVLHTAAAGTMEERFPGARLSIPATTESVLAVPLVSAGSVIGVLAVASNESGMYTDLELSLMEAVAAQIAEAVSRSRQVARQADAGEAELGRRRPRSIGLTSGGVGGAVAGAAIGTAAGPLGTVVGGAVGGLIGKAVSGRRKRKEEVHDEDDE